MTTDYSDEEDGNIVDKNTMAKTSKKTTASAAMKNTTKNQATRRPWGSKLPSTPPLGRSHELRQSDSPLLN
jgi:hypothetical protein